MNWNYYGDHFISFIYNTYYFARNGNGSISSQYYAQPAHLKAMMKANSIDCVLSGNGTKNNPYITYLVNS